MKQLSRTVASVCISIPSITLAADCAREDIDHYLDRGFSPQQVVELCRDGHSAATPEQVTQGMKMEQRLRKLLAVQNLNLSRDSLSFQRELCVKYDRPNFAEQQKRACGRGHFVIPMKNMQIQDKRKKLLFWGQDEVIVAAQGLQRKYDLGQASLSERNQKQLERALPTGDELALPLRDGASADELVELLRQISRR